MNRACMITADSVVVVLDGEVLTIKRDQGVIFDRVLEAIETSNYDAIPSILSPKDLLGKVNITFDEKTGQIFYANYPLKNNLTDRIFQFWEQDAPYGPLLNLLRKIMSFKGELEYMQEELFNFIEHNDLPITEDGCFLAYKQTNEDGSPPVWSGSEIRYHVGAVLEMPKEEASTDRATCGGAGFYFGNPGWWGSGEFENGKWIGQGRMFLVKIDPRHITAIPTNHGDGKAKCYKMEVVKEFTAEVAEEVRTVPVMETQSFGFFDITVRDSKGRFTNKKYRRDSKGRFI